MAGRGFNIKDLELLGVTLNIPPFLKVRSNWMLMKMVETRRIATLRVHVERAMEQLKSFHIFDSLLPSSFRDTANQIFFIFAVLTNFSPSLCKVNKEHQT